MPLRHDTKTLIAAAYAEPVERLTDAVKTLWPIAATTMLAIFASTPAGPTPATGLSSGWLLLPVLYLYFVSAQSAVNWHRSVILGERVGITRPWPSARAWGYIGWGFVIGALIILAALVPFFVYTFVGTGGYGRDLSFLAETVATTVAYTIAAAVFGEASLVLARTSVFEGHDNPLFKKLSLFGPSDWGVPLVLLATYIPLSIASTLVYAGLSHMGMPTLVVIAVAVPLSAYHTAVTLTAISLLYDSLAPDAPSPGMDRTDG